MSGRGWQVCSIRAQVVVERALPACRPAFHGPSAGNRFRCQLRAVNIEYSAFVRRKKRGSSVREDD
jgi:hypothetical protein